MATIPFTPNHRQQLIDALLDAFASRDELDRLVRAAFDQNPQTIIAERVNLTRAVEEVVEEAASREGGVKRLVIVAAQERTEHDALTQLVRAWQNVEFEVVPKPIETIGQTIQTEGGSVVQGDVVTDGDFVGRDKVTITEETAYNVQGLANPYLGLRSFEYKDQAIYGGREQLAEETVAKLTDPKSPQTILFITGASGSGKSSFAQAALIPLLEEHYKDYQKKARCAIFRPSSQPMVMLADALQRLHPDLTPETLTTNTPKDQINLLLIDQFEELFIQSEASQRDFFCDFLTNLPSFAASRTHILITLRVDYLDELFEIQPLWTIAKKGVELRTMKADDLRNAIQKPLQVNHPQKRFAPELLDRLVQDASGNAALLPLLQVTLAELWKTGRLVLANYHTLTDAIRQRAEAVHTFSDHADDNFRDRANSEPKIPRPVHDQHELMGILLDLINVSADAADHRDARQRRTRQELEQGSPQRPRLIEELINARLLTPAGEIRNGENVEVIDIIHESLIENWCQLRKEIGLQREQLQRRARFKLWRKLWEQNQKVDNYLLLTDIQLAEAKVLVEVNDIELREPNSPEFYRLSLEYQAKMQRTKEKEAAEHKARQQWLQRVGFALIIAIIAAVVALWQWQLAQIAADGQIQARATSDVNAALANKQRQQAQIAATSEAQARATSDLNAVTANQAKIAAEYAQATAEAAKQETSELKDKIRSTQLASEALLALEQSPARSLLIAVEGLNIRHNLEQLHFPMAEQSLRDLLHQIGGTPLVGIPGKIPNILYSQNGSYIAGVSDDYDIYVWEIAHPDTQPLILQGHTSYIRKAIFSLDGQLLASASGDTLRIWNLTQPQANPTILRGHSDIVNDIAFSSDRKYLASASDDGTMQLWDLTQLQPIPFIIQDGTNKVMRVVFSANDRWIASANSNGAVYIWDTKKLYDNPVILPGVPNKIAHIIFSPDSRWLIAASDNTFVQVWDTIQTKIPPSILRGHEGNVFNLAFSPDSKYLANGNFDNDLYIWDMTKLQKDPVVLSGHEGPIVDLQFSQDGNRLASASSDGTARIWDIHRFESLPIVLRGLEGKINTITFSPDSRKLVSASGNILRLWNLDEPQNDTLSEQDLLRNNGYELWNLPTSRISSTILRGHEDQIASVMFSSDGKQLTSVNIYGDVRIWDMSQLQTDPIILYNNKSEIWDIRFESDNTNLTVVTQDSIFRWDTMQPWKAPITLHNHKGIPGRMVLSPNGKYLANISNEDNNIRLWDITKPKVEPIVLSRHKYIIWELTFSSDSSYLASSSQEAVYIWDLSHHLTEPVRLQGHGGGIVDIAFGIDNKYVVGASFNSTDVHLWDITRPQSNPVILTGGVDLRGYKDRFSRLVFSPDNAKLTNASNNTIRVWNLNQPEAYPVTLSGHDSWVYSVKFNRDGKELASASNDSTVRLWNIDQTGTPSIILRAHEGEVNDVLYSPDGQHLASASSDRTVRLWNLTQPQENSVALRGYANGIGKMAFTPDSALLATTDYDATVRVWIIPINKLIMLACRTAGRNLTPKEWAKYFPDEPYRKTCPQWPEALDR